jgi:hypothetical protein
MTRKEAQRRLTAAIREQRAAQEEVRGANALVVEATRKLPPHYVSKRFAGGERERIQALVDRAQKASDRLGAVTADVVNLRGLVSSQQAQRTPAGQRRHATKKSPAQLDREIAESLATTRAHATMGTEDTSSTEVPLEEKLRQAAKWIRRELSKRADSSHPSHLANKVLEEADKKFKLESFGVEGWAKTPSIGYQYLNYGDPYDATIVVRSSPTRATVHVALSGWAPYAGNA